MEVGMGILCRASCPCPIWKLSTHRRSDERAVAMVDTLLGFCKEKGRRSKIPSSAIGTIHVNTDVSVALESSR